MTIVRKMFVVPCELFENMIKRNNITDNPLITAQIEIEKEKDKIIPKKPNDATLAAYSNLSLQQEALKGERSREELKPQNDVKIKPNHDTSILKRAKQHNEKQKHNKRFIHRRKNLIRPSAKLPSLIRYFYDYEPDLVTNELLTTVDERKSRQSLVISPKKTRSKKFY